MKSKAKSRFSDSFSFLKCINHSNNLKITARNKCQNFRDDTSPCHIQSKKLQLIQSCVDFTRIKHQKLLAGFPLREISAPPAKRLALVQDSLTQNRNFDKHLVKTSLKRHGYEDVTDNAQAQVYFLSSAWWVIGYMNFVFYLLAVLYRQHQHSRMFLLHPRLYLHWQWIRMSSMAPSRPLWSYNYSVMHCLKQ